LGKLCNDALVTYSLLDSTSFCSGSL